MGFKLKPASRLQNKYTTYFSKNQAILIFFNGIIFKNTNAAPQKQTRPAKDASATSLSIVFSYDPLFCRDVCP